MSLSNGEDKQNRTISVLGITYLLIEWAELHCKPLRNQLLGEQEAALYKKLAARFAMRLIMPEQSRFSPLVLEMEATIEVANYQTIVGQ